MDRNLVALEILKAIISADWKFMLVEGVDTWDSKAVERAYEVADAFIAHTTTKEVQQ